MNPLLLAATLVSSSSAAVLDVWPAPLISNGGETTVFVCEGHTFFRPSGAAASSKLLAGAFERYAQLMFPHAVPTATINEQVHINVSVEDADESYPSIDTDESYNLTIVVPSGSPEGPFSTLTAKSVFGALRGLETLSQLVRFDFDSEHYQIKGAPWVIADKPRFAHRGLMIDTARHFQPLAAIRSIVDSLPYAKINVLHWHLVDTQSFPFHSESNPKLWDGAYDARSRYTHSDVASIVDYARLRGVRVMPEFDMPGHAQSWCVGYPELCPSASCTTPLDVSRNSTFALIDRLLAECTGRTPHAGLFPDNFLHLGGDEVSTDCWESTPRIASWLKAHKLSADDAYALFVKRTAAIAIAHGRRPVQWSEVYDHFKTALPPQVIVHVWKAVTNVTEVVANGYDVLRNVGYDKTSWYLDNLNVDWRAVYANDPCSDVPDALCHKIIGGHGEMWGETVDASDLEQTVWPRLGAIAEKLWSARAATQSADDALARMQSFRCLLNERGIAAAPVNNDMARAAPAGPGKCMEQRRRRKA